ncbi:ABC1-domain-containing protein [Coccomyxa subellipsoidea C-169]|uniref:ABC1-domain-containing protein n=1 Tax=Coccomyxa subellipsoidea (strain C-169) TaxID=574566 RepID=I0YSU3_COCSC|nr:ABC1-domain-containing protein [Coccomyxa subellipsoidea C-169]EIE21462.1 ABC1-domain-containing protein [Coccomyxa subellipsoidea C-169]|eukprot:XP_005646006.1 ABC1-domain-containing protein [Coccomyxa subellipsoidea C-169]
MAVDLRGFYLKLGQFFAARAEFVPEPICRHLSLLHDRVPPMPAQQARSVIEQELGGIPLEEVFEWIDFEEPLGSASIAQVHKAKLRQPAKRRRRDFLSGEVFNWTLSAKAQRRDDCSWRVGTGQEVVLSQSPTPKSGLGQPAVTDRTASDASEGTDASGSGRDRLAEIREDLARVASSRDGPKDGIVAVKVQYPDALHTMMTDLTSIRRWAGFLQKTEIKFDMLSAVDELSKQVVLEFDFRREARVMDAVAENLKGLRKRLEIPRSVPGLVTKRLLVMNFIDGDQITRLAHRTRGLSQRKKKAAAKRIMERVAEAFGTMMLETGLFQADAHPGNILVMKGARIGLIDYGQSKQLPEAERLAFAALLLELGRERADVRPAAVTRCLADLGLRFEREDNQALMTKMAFGMFDTRTSHRVDPFSPDSPIKSLGISHFPPDVFFVLRVMQLLRGLAGGLGVDFSAARQWAPLARRALRRAGRNPA